jgi:hypothetical protein
MAKIKKARRAKAAGAQARRQGGQLARKTAPKRPGSTSDATGSGRAGKVVATVVGAAALAAAAIHSLNRGAEPPAGTPRPPASRAARGRKSRA